MLSFSDQNLWFRKRHVEGQTIFADSKTTSVQFTKLCTALSIGQNLFLVFGNFKGSCSLN